MRLRYTGQLCEEKSRTLLCESQEIHKHAVQQNVLSKRIAKPINLPLCDGGLKTVTSQGHGRVQHWSDGVASACQPARCEDPLDCFFFPLVLWKIAPWFTLSVLLIVLYVRPSVTSYSPELVLIFQIGFPQIFQICFTYFFPVAHKWVLTEKLIVPQLTDKC